MFSANQDNDLPAFKYFQVRVFTIQNINSTFHVLKVIDYSLEIHFNLSKGEKRLLEMINALVSHEMRNPINAILGMGIHIRSLISTLFDVLSERRFADPRFAQLRKDFNESIGVQESSTKLLNFYVADLLCLSQIQNGSFRKNLARFSIRDTIAEVMSLQKFKADEKQIQFTQELVGFGEDSMVATDQMRLQ